MAENTGVHIVEIRAGESQRPVLELRPGVVVQPMSIGRVGMWSVDAPGVLDVHAYVYFDGRALFVQSADAGNPAKGNGQAIGTAWQQLEIPCTIEIGRARLVYRTLDELDEDEEDKTVAQPIQIPRQPPQHFTPNAGAFSNRNNGPDSDATRLQPMGAAREPDPTVVSPLEMGMSTATPLAGVPKARPAAGMPAFSTDAGPQSQPTTVGQPPAPPPPQNTGYQAFGSVQVAVPAPPPAPGPMAQTLNSPLNSPLAPPTMPQPMMMSPGFGPPPGMPMGMPMGYPPGPGGSGPMPAMMGPPMGAPMGQGTVETGRVQNVPSSELKGWAKAVAEWKEMPPLRKVILGTFPGVLILVYMMMFDTPQPQRRPMPTGSASVAASASAAPSATTSSVATGTVAIPATTTVPIVMSAVPTTTTTTPPTTTAPPVASAKPPKGGKTPEREAIELVSQGQNTKAAALYEQLAQEHPDQPAYREAARLLRLRSAGN